MPTQRKFFFSYTEELKDLCMDHQEERASVLQAYKQQLVVELRQLEKELTRTKSCESEVTLYLQKKISELNKSRKFQQSQ